MREIKFRAWNRDRNQFVEDSELKHYAITFDEKIINFDSSGYDYIEHFDVARYTGLKDKNGVEIYEGDIVKFTDSWDRYYFIDYITKDDDASPIGMVRITTYKGVTCRWPSNRYRQLWEDHMTSGERKLKGEWTLSSSTQKWEVIGNIYENPELLESK